MYNDCMIEQNFQTITHIRHTANSIITTSGLWIPYWTLQVASPKEGKKENNIPNFLGMLFSNQVECRITKGNL